VFSYVLRLKIAFMKPNRRWMIFTLIHVPTVIAIVTIRVARTVTVFSQVRKALQEDLTTYRRWFTRYFITVNVGWVALIIVLDVLDLLQVWL
jgi:hypothetical protein